MKTTCNTIDGVYDEYGMNCYKGYTSPQISWTSAYNYCIINAPRGTQGRLAHVRTLEQWGIVKEFDDFWIGAKTNSLTEENWVPSDWYWYDSPTSIGPSFEAQYYPSSPIMGANDEGEACFRSYNENYKTEDCDSSEKYVCEYFVPQTKSKNKY